MNKTISMSIRVSEEELDKLKQAARLEAYASYSEFIRRTALKEAQRIIEEDKNKIERKWCRVIDKKSLKKLLEILKYSTENGILYEKQYSEFGCSIYVDFSSQKIVYPEDKGFVVNDKTTCNFDHPENFVVFECINRLLMKGYRPEHLELEKR